MSVMTIPSTTLYPARTGERPLTAEDMWAVPRVGAPVPSPDGSQLAVTVTTYDLEKNAGKGRIWLVPARGVGSAAGLGAARPLTSPEFSSAEPAFSPDGRRIAFTRKMNGGKAQLHVMPLDGGDVVVPPGDPRAAAAGARLLTSEGQPKACAWRLPGLGWAVSAAWRSGPSCSANARLTGPKRPRPWSWSGWRCRDAPTPRATSTTWAK